MSAFGLVLIDPYNDFLSFGGRSWPLTRDTIRAHGAIANMRRLLETCRSSGADVFYAPHARHDGRTYDRRRFFNPSILLADATRAFPASGWGGKFRRDLSPRRGDVVASEHLTSSGFVGTDLAERLEEHGVSRIALAGCLSNTCVESTARSAVELGFEVTVAVDALVAMSPEDHAAAVEGGLALVSHRLTETARLVEELR